MIDMLNSRQKLAMPGKFQYLYGDTHRSYTFHHVQAKKENSTTDTTFKKGASHRHTIVSRKHIISSIPIEQDYRIISILGKGAFAKVYRAIHLATNEEVAVKISERKHLTTLRQRRNAEREVRIMTLLHHPNIIPVREVRVLADRYVIVMQQAHGGELFDHIIKCGRLTEIVARHYFRQIVSALRYCHEVGFERVS
jgi:serine/threonine protein kinase